MYVILRKIAFIHIKLHVHVNSYDHKEIILITIYKIRHKTNDGLLIYSLSSKRFANSIVCAIKCPSLYCYAITPFDIFFILICPRLFNA